MSDDPRALLELGHERARSGAVVQALAAYEEVLSQTADARDEAAREVNRAAAYGAGLMECRLRRWDAAAVRLRELAGDHERDDPVAPSMQLVLVRKLQATALVLGGRPVDAAHTIVELSRTAGDSPQPDETGQVLDALVAVAAGLAEQQAWDAQLMVLEEIWSAYGDYPRQLERAQAAIARLQAHIVRRDYLNDVVSTGSSWNAGPASEDLRWAAEFALERATAGDLRAADAAELTSATRCLLAELSGANDRGPATNQVARLGTRLRSLGKGRTDSPALGLLTYPHVLPFGQSWNEMAGADPG